MPFKFGRERKLVGSIISVMLVFAVTAILLPLRPQLNSAEVALALLLVVLIAATMFGSRAGLAATVVGVACFNFFFLPPYYTFTIADPQNWTAFGAFIITALIAGQLSGYARRRAEESEERKTEIERLYKELQEAFDKASEAEGLRRSEKLKSSLLDAVTHDLRTPLTSIKAAVTTLLDTDGDAQIDEEVRGELLDIIDEETDRLNEFIEGIVGVARFEAGALNLSRRSSSAEEIISIAVSRAAKQLRKRQVNVSVPPDLPNLFADASSVAQAIFTVLDNAAKYSEPDTRVMISAEQTASEEIRIIVQDEGTGIPPEMRETVFAKFYRGGEDSHIAGSGLGLGLAFARGIVESQGGSIWIEDGDDEFVTKFIISLPIDETNIEDSVNASS